MNVAIKRINKKNIKEKEKTHVENEIKSLKTI